MSSTATINSRLAGHPNYDMQPAENIGIAIGSSLNHLDIFDARWMIPKLDLLEIGLSHTAAIPGRSGPKQM